MIAGICICLDNITLQHGIVTSLAEHDKDHACEQVLIFALRCARRAFEFVNVVVLLGNFHKIVLVGLYKS